MDIVDVVRAHGGVVPSTLLIAQHCRPHVVEKAVASGRLVRIRRRWVAVPDADPLLRSAARTGVVLSCVTQARRQGLWVLEHESGEHVAARTHAGRVDARPGTRVHWQRPPIARSPDQLEDPIENVLAIVSTCQPTETALAIWESAIRRKLVDPLALRRLDLPNAAHELLAGAAPYSDSGLETFVVPRLRWTGLRIVPQVWIASHRVDFLIGDRLALQIDGGHHVGPQRTSDIAHDAQLMLMGFHVIRVGYTQVVQDWPGVQDVIMRAVAQGLHRAA